MNVQSAKAFDHLVDALLTQSQTLSNPWKSAVVYAPDYLLLTRLLSVPVRQGAAQESGRFAKATDMWVGEELRRAGFGANEVWPRRARPRVLPQSLAAVERALTASGAKIPATLKNTIRGWANAKLLGQYYPKQVDVVIAEWDRGAELMVSTKSMLSSYWNNLRNRFEEFVGDAKNLRGRYPLAAIGILFVVRSTIHDEVGAFDFAVDMLRRLRGPDLYDTAGLLVAQWSDSNFGSWQGDADLDNAGTVTGLLGAPTVVSVEAAVPDDLRPERFLAELIDCVLARTPVTYHVEPRQRRLGQAMPVQEEGQDAQDAETGG